MQRDAFIGPNVWDHNPGAIEPDFGYQEQPLVPQSFTFYNRKCVYYKLSSGELEITAYYIGRNGWKEIVETSRKPLCRIEIVGA